MAEVRSYDQSNKIQRLDMKFKDFRLDIGNHFIAMEYYGIILNRTFLILITEDNLIGLKVSGLIGLEGGNDPITKAITKEIAISNDLENPYSYMKSVYLRKMENMDVFGDEILKVKRTNFKMDYDKMRNVTYDKTKKWGMGYYPHDGRLYIEMEKGKKREFIILGSQSGKVIKECIEKHILNNKTE